MLIVRCPACQTTFRARPEHLGARAGRVRCGHCYTPFNGLENLVDSLAPEETVEEKPIPTGMQTKGPTAPLREEDGQSSRRAVFEAPGTETSEATSREERTSDLDERLALALSPSNEIDLRLGGDDREQDYGDDFDLHEAFTEPPDITPLGPGADEQDTLSAVPEPAQGRADTHEALRWSPVRNPRVTTPTSLSNAVWPTLVAQPAEPETIQPRVFPAGTRAAETSSVGEEFDEGSWHVPPPELGLGSPLPITTDPDERPWRSATAEPREPAFGTNEPPATHVSDEDNPDFAHYARGESRGRVWLWAVMVGVLLGSLAMQSVYVFRVELAQQWPQLRPVFVDLCDHLACDMPLPRNPQAIQVTASNLESDPSVPTSFVLHARLHNNAGYLQAHPHLELTLTDARDRPVARRVLEPGEWLPAEAVEAGFDSRAELELRLPFSAPELTNATGYRIYAFYP